MEMKYKLKHFMDAESIDILLMDDEEKSAIVEEKMRNVQELLEQGDSIAKNKAKALKLFGQGATVFLFEMLSDSLRKKDPAYHVEFWQEIQKKKGEAHIDLDYLGKKMPILRDIYSTVGIHEPNNLSTGTSSFTYSSKLRPKNLEKTLKSKGKSYTLSGKAAQEVGNCLIAATIIKGFYASVRKELNLPSTSV